MAKIAWSSEGEATASVIQRAHALHDKHAPALARHARIPGLLEGYRHAIDATSRLTVALGIPAFCIACSARDAVCCFQEVARRYDEHLLLVNLLLGDAGQWTATPGTACHYCGPQGCVLAAKCSFCLNFYCEAIQSGLGAAGMAQINRQVGMELERQWELERVITPWLWAEKHTRKR